MYYELTGTNISICDIQFYESMDNSIILLIWETFGNSFYSNQIVGYDPKAGLNLPFKLSI